MTANRLGLRRVVVSSAVAMGVAAAGWWALLGWDTEKTRGSDGYLHGQFDAWQVVGLVVALVLLGVWLGRRSAGLGASTAAAITLAVCFGISAEHDPQNDGLWPVGASLLLIGSFSGIAAVAAVTRWIKARDGRRAAHWY